MKRVTMQRRGRPSRSVEQKDREGDLTRRLVKEIRKLSGMKSYHVVADTLFNPLDTQNKTESITGETLRQYASGRVASALRRRHMAEVAIQHGFGGIEAARAARRSVLIEEDPYRDYYRRVMEREEQKAVALAEKGVAALSNVLCAEDATSILLSMVARLCHPYVEYVDVDE